MNHDLLERH